MVRLPEVLVETLIWLPAVIAWSRGCRLQYLIPITVVSATLSLVDFLDLVDQLSTHNARHSLYAFIAEVLVWLPAFILSIYAREK
mgnify:CR=1 FL=1